MSIVTPIRQPRGPSAEFFGGPTQNSDGPLKKEQESSLRRANTVASPHHKSSSVSSTPSASSAFHGARLGAASGRFRSGSLSTGAEGGLVRRGSAREVKTEAPVPEIVEEGTTEVGHWGKGLSRQSSLPSRRGINLVTASTPAVPTEPRSTRTIPPPRPPRRISTADAMAVVSPPPSHSASLSLSSITAFNRPNGTASEEQVTQGASVSRTQSLRAQAKILENSRLGRSSSLRSTGEQRGGEMEHLMSPVSQMPTPRHPFTPPTPPPMSSMAALPPFALPLGVPHDSEGADLRRHQSLTQGYGSSNRVRDRLERTGALLTLDQRTGHSRKISEDREEPPTSPLGYSPWSQTAAMDDGWNRPPAASTQQMADALEAMDLGRRMMTVETPQKQILSVMTDVQRSNHPHTAAAAVPGIGHSTEEPSWVANLVGLPNGRSPQPELRVASTTAWMRNGHQHPNYLGQPFSQLTGFPTATSPLHQNQYTQPFGYTSSPFTPLYPTPPPTAAIPNNDQEVIELARQKGLNPATYNCRPPVARFFVIKSYTEEDVQKSLKHEIWSSTVLGNKRLDTAFRESAEQMPIFLFFSVNGSRHFCGVAQMLTLVDESTSSTVWAQDKWKGIFKVKWIFVRDVPTAALRHIRLINTPEQKPITNSRDTQELHYEAGCEVLQIFLDRQAKSKTSLLQDFAYYEQMSVQRNNGQNGQMLPPPPPHYQSMYLQTPARNGPILSGGYR